MEKSIHAQEKVPIAADAESHGPYRDLTCVVFTPIYVRESPVMLGHCGYIRKKCNDHRPGEATLMVTHVA